MTLYHCPKCREFSVSVERNADFATCQPKFEGCGQNFEVSVDYDYQGDTSIDVTTFEAINRPLTRSEMACKCEQLNECQECLTRHEDIMDRALFGEW